VPSSRQLSSVFAQIGRVAGSSSGIITSVRLAKIDTIELLNSIPVADSEYTTVKSHVPLEAEQLASVAGFKVMGAVVPQLVLAEPLRVLSTMLNAGMGSSNGGQMITKLVEDPDDAVTSISISSSKLIILKYSISSSMSGSFEQFVPFEATVVGALVYESPVRILERTERPDSATLGTVTFFRT